MTKHHDYGNDRIYRIIGGTHCQRLDGDNFVCGSRAALKDHRKAQTDEPIPGGVYWLAEADNFYCAKGGGGMGLAFYRKWRERANEFPTETSS